MFSVHFHSQYKGVWSRYWKDSTKCRRAINVIEFVDISLVIDGWIGNFGKNSTKKIRWKGEDG